MNRGPEIVKVTFSYEAQNQEELGLAVGEIVTVTEKYDNGWCKGEKNGKIGIFPFNYVEPASQSDISTYTPSSSSSSSERVIAIQDFQGSSSQLSFKKDDVINVIEKFPTGWWKGELNGRVGVFPRSSVRLESEPAPGDRKSRRNTVNLSNGPTPPPVPDRKRSSTQLSNNNLNSVGKALYSYKGTGPGQLSFNKNDTIKILERKESGWWRGELNGTSGLFPSNYIETTAEDSDEEDEAQQYDSGVSATLDEVVALYPYKASGPGQLSFGKDERISVIEKTESGWWRGDLRGTVGLFPSNYVKVVSVSQPNSALNTNNPYEDEEDAENGEEEVTSHKPVARARALYEYQATTSHELSLYPEQVINVFSKLDNGWWQGEVDGNIGHFPSTYVEEIPFEEPSTANTDFLKRTQSGVPQVATEVSSAGQGQKAKALYAYTGKTDRELSFAQGEELTVLKKFDNGWWQGEYKGKVGHFPGNYVKEVTAGSDAASTPVAPQSPSVPTRGAPNKPIPPVPPRVKKSPTPSESNTPTDPSPPVPNRRSMTVAPPRPAPPSSDSYASDLSAAKKQQTLGVLRAPSMTVAAMNSLGNSNGTSNANTASASSGGPSLESIKKALITLQQQTKTAVDGMLKRLDAQNKERSKLEYVMRDMKRCLKEEQQQRELVQSDIKILQSQYRAANGVKPDLNQLPTPELINHVGLLNNKLDLEVKARKELQTTVTKLQSDVEQLTRKLKQLEK